MSSPITTDFMTFFALFREEGFGPPKKNIIPPTTSISTATGGTISISRNFIILFSRTKRWQKVHGLSPSPPQGTSPAPWVMAGKSKKETDRIKYFLLILRKNIFLFANGIIPDFFSPINFLEALNIAVPPEGFEPSQNLVPKTSALSG